MWLNGKFLDVSSCYAWPLVLASGWVTGWHQGMLRNVSYWLPKPTQTIRTPLLKLYVEKLKLRPDASSSSRQAEHKRYLVQRP